MSDLTPPSFYDDGLDFNNRTSRRVGRDVSRWLDSIQDSASSVTASTYPDTASYLDDGATSVCEIIELRPDAVSKVGTEKYHPDVQRAVSGQVQNVLKNMWAVSHFHVKDASNESKEMSTHGKKGSKPPPGAVRVRLPAPPPTFVIHGDNGHLVVVDGLEEPIDSKPVGEVEIDDEEVGRWLQGGRKDSDRRRARQRKTHDDEKGRARQKRNRQGEPKKTMQDAYRRQAEELDWSTDSDSAATSRPAFFKSAGAERRFTVHSVDSWADSWEEDGTEVTRSNYQAPTAEDAPSDDRSSVW